MKLQDQGDKTMSDSTALGIARVAAAMTELMRAHASPADRAIQDGINQTMRDLIRQQATARTRIS